MLRAAFYIRVSTEEQSEYSPAAQEKALRLYAQKHDLSVNEEHIFIDEGYSGRQAAKRPAFMRMIALAKAKPRPFDVILVHKFDRFARSREDSVVYKSLLRSQCSIKVISVTEELEDDKFSVILESMLEAMAEFYSLNLAEEVTKGMREKATRGELQTQPCYGYRVKDNTLQIYEPEAAFVRLIFAEFLAGEHSFFQLAQKINALGARSKRGNPFESRTIEYILHNPTYCGLLPWTPSKHKNRDWQTPETITAPARHEPIISPADFARVQTILAEQAHRKRPKARPAEEYRHWLSGLLKCSCCGSTLVLNSRRPSPTFQCRRYTAGKCPVSHSLSLGKAEKAVLTNLATVFPPASAAYRLRPISAHTADAENLRKQLIQIDRRLDRARQSYLHGIDTEDEYLRTKTELLAQKEACVARLRQISAEPSAENAPAIRHIMELLNSQAPLLLKSKTLQNAIAKIVYNKAEHSLEIYYYL